LFFDVACTAVKSLLVCSLLYYCLTLLYRIILLNHTYFKISFAVLSAIAFCPESSQSRLFGHKKSFGNDEQQQQLLGVSPKDSSNNNKTNRVLTIVLGQMGIVRVCSLKEEGAMESCRRNIATPTTETFHTIGFPSGMKGASFPAAIVATRHILVVFAPTGPFRTGVNADTVPRHGRIL
jgi:hypothetical protein